LPRILVDENVTWKIREWLKQQGFDTINVSEMGLKGKKDQVIAEYAAKNNLIILTLDTDFAQIYHNSPKGTLGVIVIRANPSVPAVILETLVQAHEKLISRKPTINL
jgi:predicted nuclease of predicted toxin-antitoxin system